MPPVPSKPVVRGVRQQEREDSRNSLREMLKPGTKVYTILTHVSRSGMSRNIKVIYMKGGQPIDISYSVANVLGYPQADDGSVKIGGAGMDMGFALVYELGYALYPKGFKTEPGYWRNEPMEYETDGGYALKQEWM
jgi:hypothetical protein